MNAEQRWDRLARPPLTGLLAVTLVGLVYTPGLQAGFVGDDFMILHRLRGVESAADLLSFFRGEFFQYYRPLGFVSHGVDWLIAGPDPRQFHITNLLLHLINTMLVLALGIRLAPGTIAGPVAALLFALHAAHHEPVMWISARFDLLATTGSLSALLLMLTGRNALAATAFLFALLSKESAAALPLAAAAWAVLGLRQTRWAAAAHVAPWLAAMVVYALAREIGGGVSAVGGAGRLPKLSGLAVGIGALLWLGGGRWVPAATWAQLHRRPALAVLGLLLGSCALAVLLGEGPISGLIAQKLAVAGFMSVNLLSPIPVHASAPFYLDPASTMFWLGGLLALSALLVLCALLWRGLFDDARVLFLLVLLAATLLPVSALTEGTRYLYLPSAPLTLLLGLAGARLAARPAVLAVVSVLLAVSSVQIAHKVRDWIWAGRMTADAVRLVDEALAPGCGEGHVVFLTSPVAVRGVYTHFYYETFETPRGCQPAVFQVVARAVRREVAAEALWDEAGGLVVRVANYHGGLVLSRDLRHFDVPLQPGQHISLETPLGLLSASAGEAGGTAQLTLASATENPRYFYYSEGRMHALPHRRTLQ